MTYAIEPYYVSRPTPVGYHGGQTATGLPAMFRPLGRIDYVWSVTDERDTGGLGVVSDAGPVVPAFGVVAG